MTKYFQDADLSRDSLDVGLLDNFLFLEGFDCDLLIGGDVQAQANLAKSALTYTFTYIPLEVPIL